MCLSKLLLFIPILFIPTAGLATDVAGRRVLPVPVCISWST